MPELLVNLCVIIRIIIMGNLNNVFIIVLPLLLCLSIVTKYISRLKYLFNLFSEHVVFKIKYCVSKSQQNVEIAQLACIRGLPNSFFLP